MEVTNATKLRVLRNDKIPAARKAKAIADEQVIKYNAVLENFNEAQTGIWQILNAMPEEAATERRTSVDKMWTHIPSTQMSLLQQEYRGPEELEVENFANANEESPLGKDFQRAQSSPWDFSEFGKYNRRSRALLNHSTPAFLFEKIRDKDWKPVENRRGFFTVGKTMFQASKVRSVGVFEVKGVPNTRFVRIEYEDGDEYKVEKLVQKRSDLRKINGKVWKFDGARNEDDMASLAEDPSTRFYVTLSSSHPHGQEVTVLGRKFHHREGRYFWSKPNAQRESYVSSETDSYSIN